MSREDKDNNESQSSELKDVEQVLDILESKRDVEEIAENIRMQIAMTVLAMLSIAAPFSEMDSEEYIADFFNNVVRERDVSESPVNTLSDNGALVESQNVLLQGPLVDHPVVGLVGEDVVASPDTSSVADVVSLDYQTCPQGLLISNSAVQGSVMVLQANIREGAQEIFQNKENKEGLKRLVADVFSRIYNQLAKVLTIVGQVVGWSNARISSAVKAIERKSKAFTKITKARTLGKFASHIRRQYCNHSPMRSWPI